MELAMCGQVILLANVNDGAIIVRIYGTVAL